MKMDVTEFKKPHKYEVVIETGENGDNNHEDYSAVHDFLTELLNELLDDDVTVLVARIPDDFAIDQIEDDVEVVMVYLREEFSTRAPKVFVLGSRFDIKCTNKPDKIIMWPEIIELAFPDVPEGSDNDEALLDNFKKAVDDMINKMNAPKIITPNIIV